MVALAVCHLLRNSVAAIFGPQSENTANHVQSICDALEVPHIETRWDYKLMRDEYSLNLYPHPKSLSKVRTLSKTFQLFRKSLKIYLYYKY